jgi:hypothetical protein
MILMEGIMLRRNFDCCSISFPGAMGWMNQSDMSRKHCPEGGDTSIRPGTEMLDNDWRGK